MTLDSSQSRHNCGGSGSLTTSVHGHPSPPANSVPQSPLLASNDGSDDCSSKFLSLTSSLVAKLEVISLVLF